jgi:hypothetical protein
MINKKIVLFVLLMLGTVTCWANDPSTFIYTINGNGTHSILIDFARIGSYTDPNGTVSTIGGTYYADYLSGPYMNTGIEEYNYAFNQGEVVEGASGTVVVANKFGLQSVSMTPESTFFYSVENWREGVPLTGYPGENYVHFAPYSIAQKITTPISHTWFLMVSGLVSMWCAARKKRTKQNV